MRTSRGLVGLLLTMCVPIHAEWQPLWPAGAPGSPSPAVVQEKAQVFGSEAYVPWSELADGNFDAERLTDISEPACWFYPADPARRTGAAVVIFPGGGYGILAISPEGHDYARWLSERGIAAVVVKYRVSRGDEAGFHFPAPFLDARRAIRLTRQRAGDWQIDPDKIGVMGSSAGGHLASMCLTLFDVTYALEGPEPQTSCRPDFGILVYPVIGLDAPWAHMGSRRRLLGPDHADRLAAELSTHRRVTDNTPPCFLLHAADDRGVPAQNSLEFAAACAANGVPVVVQITAKGGHGFGLSGPGDAANWPDLLERWLESRSWEKGS